MFFSFLKHYKVRCPDGSIRIIHRNVDEVLPLFIPGWSANVSASATGTATTVGLDSATAELSGAYASKVQGLLFAINDSNQAIIMQFRGAYLAFMGNPCTNSAAFERQVEQLNNQYHNYSQLRIQVYALMELAKSQPNNTAQILLTFREIAGRVGGAPAIEATKEEIDESRKLADGWIKK